MKPRRPTAAAERDRQIEELNRPPTPEPAPPAPILFYSYHAQCPACLEDLADSEWVREDGQGDPRASAIRSYETHWRRVHARQERP